MPQRNVTALPQRAGNTTSHAPVLSVAGDSGWFPTATPAPALADGLAAGWFPSVADRTLDPSGAKAYRRALRRSTAAVALVEAARVQTIQDQVEAAYAEYDDEYRTEYLAYVDEVAA